MFEQSTARPLAIFESTLITAMRTCAAGSVGVEALARHDANKVAVIGAGLQGAWQLRALLTVRNLVSASVYDISRERAVRFATRMGAELGIVIKAAASVSEACAEVGYCGYCHSECRTNDKEELS